MVNRSTWAGRSDIVGYSTEGYDAVFTAAGARVVPTLPGVPRVNAIAER